MRFFRNYLLSNTSKRSVFAIKIGYIVSSLIIHQLSVDFLKQSLDRDWNMPLRCGILHLKVIKMKLNLFQKDFKDFFTANYPNFLSHPVLSQVVSEIV